MLKLILVLFTLFTLCTSADIVCATVGGTAKFLTQYNTCVCVAPAQLNLPGTFCPTDNGQAGCSNSCGLNCISAVVAGGGCFLTSCNVGYTPVNGVCVLNASANPTLPIRRRQTHKQAQLANKKGPAKDGSWDPVLCPKGLLPCSVHGSQTSWECVDVMNDVDSCGGCVQTHGGLGSVCSESKRERCILGSCTSDGSL